MNVATITMPPAEAREKLRHYRKSLHRRADAEYEAIAQGLEELGAGRALLNVGDAIRNAPTDEKGRPKLAIARADRKPVHFHRRWRMPPSTFEFDTSRRGPTDADEAATFDSLRIHIDGLSAVAGSYIEGYALVPIVPPEVLGTHGLVRSFVLWEVEQWADRRISARADRDPYLLRHLGGELYAVLGAWDLTELERAVMAGRANL